MAKHKGEGIQDKGKVKAKSSAKSKAKSSAVAEPRRVKVVHDKCGDARLDYVLFPIGFRYNEALQSLRRGDIVVFLDGSEHYVWSVLRLSLNSAIAEYLCWMRYGFGIARAVDVWHERLRFSKEDLKVMSADECLILFFDREEVRYEQKRK